MPSLATFGFRFFFSQGYGVILYKRYIKNSIPLPCAAFIRLQHQLVSESLDKYLNCYINDSDYKASPGYSKNKCSWTINPSNQMRILKSCGIYYVSLNRTNVYGEMVMIFSLLQCFHDRKSFQEYLRMKQLSKSDLQSCNRVEILIVT